MIRVLARSLTDRAAVVGLMQIWGNKKIVIFDIPGIPTPSGKSELDSMLSVLKQQVMQGNNMMRQGALMIKSAYQHPNHYRNPNQMTKRKGITQKTAGKNMVRIANRDMDKVKVWTKEIWQLLTRNQNLLSLKEQMKIGGAMAKARDQVAVMRW